MLSKTLSSAILGIDAYLIEVEVDISKGLPYFSTVGLPDGAVKLSVSEQQLLDEQIAKPL